MTGLEIKQAAENYLDELITNDEALTAINAALSALGDLALVYDTVSGPAENAVAGTWYPLPAKLTNVVEVVDSAGDSYPFFRKRDNLICFDDAGSYTIHFRRLPNSLADLTETPEVHEAFHQVLVTHVIAWWKLKDDDESPDGLRQMQKFESDAMRVVTGLRRKRGPRTVTVIR